MSDRLAEVKSEVVSLRGEVKENTDELKALREVFEKVVEVSLKQSFQSEKIEKIEERLNSHSKRLRIVENASGISETKVRIQQWGLRLLIGGIVTIALTIALTKGFGG